MNGLISGRWRRPFRGRRRAEERSELRGAGQSLAARVPGRRRKTGSGIVSLMNCTEPSHMANCTPPGCWLVKAYRLGPLVRRIVVRRWPGSSRWEDTAARCDGVVLVAPRILVILARQRLADQDRIACAVLDPSAMLIGRLFSQISPSIGGRSRRTWCLGRHCSDRDYTTPGQSPTRWNCPADRHPSWNRCRAV